MQSQRDQPRSRCARAGIVLWRRAGATGSLLRLRAMPSTVTITARGEQRLMNGHPWIYRADVGAVGAAAGDCVIVRNGRGRTLGRALYSDRSQIAIRMLTADGGETD